MFSTGDVTERILDINQDNLLGLQVHWRSWRRIFTRKVLERPPLHSRGGQGARQLQSPGRPQSSAQYGLFLQNFASKISSKI